MLLHHLQLQHYNGALALVSPDLPDVAASFGVPVRQPKLHITLLSAAEYKSISRPSLSTIVIPTNHVYILGPGQSRIARKVTQWLVVVWNHGNVWRRTVGLGEKQFHVTLSEHDEWNSDKGISSLLSGGASQDEILHNLEQLDAVGLDHCVVAAEGSAFHCDLAERLVLRHPNFFRGYIRLAEAVALTNPKLALLCYARAAAHDSSLTPSVVKRILRLRDTALYGALITEAERQTLNSALLEHVLLPFPKELDTALSPFLWTCPTESRERQWMHAAELPRFFSWLYPARLAGMSTPRKREDITLLHDLGITHILTLTEESPLNTEWFRFSPVKHVFVPVANYGAPTLSEMDAIHSRIDAGGTWLVHCGGGKGRAGTVLACMMSMWGQDGEVGEDVTPRMDAKTAISLLRRMRPGSIESKIQEDFITKWLNHRWKMAYAMTQLEEPYTMLKQEVNHKELPRGIQPAEVGILFLVGLPGSGKSWLSSAISKRRKLGKTIIVSQDESGSRRACETEISRQYASDTLLILDRCNPDADDRSYWLKLIDGSRKTVAIYFDYPTELCRQRVNSRLDHPTIKAGRGDNALAQMERAMSRPQMPEGFAAVLTVDSQAAAWEAVQLIGGNMKILKFPSTAHLINLGASTPDDLVREDVFSSKSGHFTVEEKVDGANMGFSLDADKKLQVQNRSHYISHAEHAQFKPLKAWLERHGEEIVTLLDRDAQFPERFILYGEWCVLQHSIHYTALPAPFLAFDLYDRHTGQFVSRRVLTGLLKGTGLRQVPLIEECEVITRGGLLALIGKKSEFTDGRLEGVYVREEDGERQCTVDRTKVVRGDFIAGNKHWTRGGIVRNGFMHEAMMDEHE